MRVTTVWIGARRGMDLWVRLVMGQEVLVIGVLFTGSLFPAVYTHNDRMG